AADLVASLKAQMGGKPKTEKAEAEVTYPKWAGRAGWQLSDGSYIAREDDEDKDGHKARAEAAEAALTGT
ncbi:MAG: hypothetical protein NUW01_02020, partial [Gemmatimonadaceae bacterium]|nr:hypothetical protein [Gemmatimonadaceae bacterium]